MFEFTDNPEQIDKFDYQYKKFIKVNDQSKFVQNVNAVHGRGGTLFAGHFFGNGTDGFEVSTTSYTDESSATVTRTGTNIELEQLNGTIKLNDKLHIANNGKSIVEIEVSGKNANLKTILTKKDGNNEVSATTETIFTSCSGSSRVTKRTYSDALTANDEYLITFEARKNSDEWTTGYINQIVIRELPLENLEYKYRDTNLEVKGSFYIGQYDTGDGIINGWDSDGAPRTFVEGNFLTPPEMNRNDLSTYVHSGEFNGARYMSTSGSLDFELGDEGFIFACAMNPTGSHQEYHIALTKLTNPSYSGYIGMRYIGGVPHVRTRMNYSGGQTVIEYPVSTGWHDIVLWDDGVSDSNILYVDGFKVAEEDTLGSFESNLYYSVLGALGDGNGTNFKFDGYLTMPTIMSGSFTEREVDRYTQWRRMIHGIFLNVRP